MPRGPLKHILLRVELEIETKIGLERIICVRKLDCMEFTKVFYKTMKANI